MSNELQGIIDMLEKRADWLRSEWKNGGSYEHLSVREQECRYIVKKLRDLAEVPRATVREPVSHE